MEEYPALRAIYTVVRQMLEVRGLTDVYFGGLGSYSIFMMVVASFKLHPRPENDSLAQHLIDFLTFYTKLDTNELWVSIEPPSLTKKIEAKPKQSIEEKQKLKDQLGIGKVNPNQPYLLSLRDPADKSNDLGRKCFCWKHVQTTMAVLREELLLRLEANDGTLLLTPLVGRNFKLLETKREHLQKFYSGRNMDNALRYLEGGFGTGSGNDSGESNMESAKDSEESNIESVRDVEESNVESAGEVEESHMESAGEFEESNLESAGELEGSNTGSAEGFKEPTLDSDKASEEPSEDKTEGSSST
ncbi:uncharacterized protein K452DRAFT_282448 [Aplosporella prunicola CBS 121167]|uniref:PAP-associated domain-containing protein n=1 Tax=Aplosporella prunicola CBS 121167 TaxID=1176127 RepID=A0A6A6BVR8_9PEZI|nr:uncharacterized protein K452DRAFT_282448 [Aplosporella prunicola CBS 121167]KAF2147443.1 hypothetical protein K452DRAFT_282448 [Aplosporella prunicola CBS 121167]